MGIYGVRIFSSFKTTLKQLLNGTKWDVEYLSAFGRAVFFFCFDVHFLEAPKLRSVLLFRSVLLLFLGRLCRLLFRSVLLLFFGLCCYFGLCYCCFSVCAVISVCAAAVFLVCAVILVCAIAVISVCAVILVCVTVLLFRFVLLLFFGLCCYFGLCWLQFRCPTYPLRVAAVAHKRPRWAYLHERRCYFTTFFCALTQS